MTKKTELIDELGELIQQHTTRVVHTTLNSIVRIELTRQHEKMVCDSSNLLQEFCRGVLKDEMKVFSPLTARDAVEQINYFIARSKVLNDMRDNYRDENYELVENSVHAKELDQAIKSIYTDIFRMIMTSKPNDALHKSELEKLALEDQNKRLTEELVLLKDQLENMGSVDEDVELDMPAFEPPTGIGFMKEPGEHCTITAFFNHHDNALESPKGHGGCMEEAVIDLLSPPIMTPDYVLKYADELYKIKTSSLTSIEVDNCVNKIDDLIEAYRDLNERVRLDFRVKN